MKLKLSKNLRRICYDVLINIFPVMIGVYLGIHFNNKNEDRKQEELKKKVIASLITESENNLKVLQTSLAYFEQLKDSTSNPKSTEKSPSSFSFWKGLNPPEELSSTAFEVAQITNTLTNMKVETLQSLSEVYTGQENLKEQSNTYIQSMTDKIGSKDFTNSFYYTFLFNYAYDQVLTEKGLIQDMEQLLSKLKQE